MNKNLQPSRRLARSLLAVPATSDHLFEKAAKGPADAIFLDLEDAVAPDRKIEARALAVAALDRVDWRSKLVSVRINALDTPWALADILALARCKRINSLLIPKVEHAEDVAFLSYLLDAIEREKERPQIAIDVLIENARGVSNADAIAAASIRLETIMFGVGDYSVDLGISEFLVNGALDQKNAPLGQNRWHYAQARIVNACRANGLRPIDTVFMDIDDDAGFRRAAESGLALGYEGKLVIHPRQVLIANDVFSPNADEVAWAESILTMMTATRLDGRGAIALDGRLIDSAHVRLAERISARSRSSNLANEG